MRVTADLACSEESFRCFWIAGFIWCVRIICGVCPSNWYVVELEWKFSSPPRFVSRDWRHANVSSFCPQWKRWMLQNSLPTKRWPSVLESTKVIFFLFKVLWQGKKYHKKCVICVVLSSWGKIAYCCFILPYQRKCRKPMWIFQKQIPHMYNGFVYHVTDWHHFQGVPCPVQCDRLASHPAWPLPYTLW